MRRSAILMEAQPMEAGRCGVASPAEFMPALSVSLPELLRESPAGKSCYTRNRLVPAIDQHRVEHRDEFGKALRSQALISDRVDHCRISKKPGNLRRRARCSRYRDIEF